MPRRSESSKKSLQVFCLIGFSAAILILSLLFPDYTLAGSIAGTVTDAVSGAPVYPVTVRVMDNYLDYRASVSTNINGDYIFNNLSAGQYLIKASTGNSGYVAEFYQSALNYYTASLIDLDETQELSGIDIQLETGQSITGRITDQDTNLPVSGVTVYALPEETLQYPWHEIWEDTNMMVSCFGYGGLCKTDPNGRYVIKGIPPGRYFVGAEAGDENTNPYVTEYFGESLSPFLAALIPVTETEGAGHIDIAMETGGIIGGAVTDPNGRGVEGAMVIMERVLSWIYGIDETDLMMKARTDPNGIYRIRGLPPGNYKAYLSKYSLNPYLACTHGSDPYQVLTIKISRGAVIEDADFLLARPPGRITGTVRSASDGSPVRGISLTLISYNDYSQYFPYPLPAFLYGYGSNYWPDYSVAESFTDVTGQYTLSGLSPGTYLVRASSDSFLRGNVNRFVSRTYTVSGREAPIALLPPNETPGIDLYLESGGSISGIVRDSSDGTPIPGIPVRAYNKSYGKDIVIKSANYTDRDGRYRIRGLDRGSYIVYIGEDPRIITFSPGPTPYPFFASSGYIDVSGPRSTTTYSSGDYPYLGEYIPESYKSNYWHVRVNPPEDTLGIDFDLVRGGSITGSVSAEDSGEPLASAEVRAIMMAGYPDKIYCARTDVNGFYSIIGLHEGEYQLEALDQKWRYLQSDIRLARVKAGETLTDQNFSLRPGGSISGIITDETTGLPIPNIVVSTLKFCEHKTNVSYSEPEGAYEYNDSYYLLEEFSFPHSPYGGYAGPYGGLWNRGAWNPIMFPVTDSEGRYTITGLPSGEYLVSCSDPERTYMSEHYPDIPGLPVADLTDETLIRLERDLDPMGEIHPCLQVRYQVIHSLKIHLLLRDKNGSDVPVIIRLGTSQTSYIVGMNMDGIYLGPDLCFASVLGPKGTIESFNIIDSGHWGILQVNLEDLLAKYFSSLCYDGDQGVSSSGLDTIIRIGLEGNGFRMDYIRLVSNAEGDQIPYVDIDGFNYPDMPMSHGWQITSAMAPHITMMSGDDLEGGGGMRVLAETPVQVTEGEQTGGIDMAMAPAESGRVSGRVTDAEDSHPVSGICIDLFRIDDQPGSGYSAYETITDQEGEYTMDGLAAGIYALLARHKNNGPYLSQWHGNIQTRLNTYNQYAYSYGQDVYPYMDDFPPASLKKPDLTGFTNPHLEFMTMTRSPFTLSIHVLTDSGKQVRIKFCRIGEYGISTARIRISDTILVPLPDESFSKGLWTRFRYDLNGILEEHLSAQLDHVLSVEIEGGLYFIDDIRLTEEGREDQVIDDFDYTDSPLNHGWMSDSPPWFSSIQAHDLGRACLLVTSVSAVHVEEGTDIDGIDFSLRLAGGISGTVVDAKEGNPMSGVQLHAFADKMGLTYSYYFPPYNYGFGIMLGNNEIHSDRNGSYTITGLLPGQYRVQALDMDNLYSSFLYEHIPMKYVPVSAGGVVLTEYASDNMTSLAKDLTPRNITNPKLQVDFIFYEKFAFRVRAEATDASVMELNFYTGYSTPDDWYKDAEEDPNIPAFSMSLRHETVYNGHSLKEDRWESWDVSLDDIVSSEFSKTMKRVNEIRMIGNSYRIASIRFLQEGEADQSADDLDYTDSPLNHGWVTSKPETTNPVMIWDTLIEKMTLDCTPAKLITVEEGTITQGIDFQLLSANRVTGRITDTADGAPLSGIRVFIRSQDPWPSQSSEAYTDQNGRYSLFVAGSFDPANYEIKANNWKQGIYTDASYPYPVELSAGMEVDGIDFTMEEGARVTGRVTYAGTNTAAEGAFVECLAPDSPSSTLSKTINSVRADSDGNYCLRGIPKGGYVIYAMSGDFKHEGYYRDNRDCLDPLVICEPGKETSGIDISLNLIEKSPEDDGTYSKPYQEISYSLLPPGSGTPLGAYTTFSYYNSPSLDSLLWNPLTITSRPGTFASAGQTYTYSVSLEDPNRWTDINCYLTEAPSGMNMDSETCRISWTPAMDQVGEHAVKIEAYAPDAGIAGQNFTIRVLPYMIIESAEGDASPLLNGEWGVLQGTGAFTDTNDLQFQSRVLVSQSDEPDLLDFRIGYPLESPLQNPRLYLSFAIQSDHDFRFCVRVNADGEEYIVQYVPVDGNFVVSGNSVVYPIGAEYGNGQWHLCKRDLQKDIEPFGVTFEWVSYFEIWGDCRMDDLWLSYQPVDYRIFPLRLYKGFNLISLPIKSDHMDSDDLAELCTVNHSYLRRRNTFSQRWEEEFDPVRPDQGFLVYSNQEKWITLKGTQKEVYLEDIASYLKSGINLVSPPSPQGKGYKGADMLNHLRSYNQKALGIHMFDRRKGAWLSGLPFFNRTTGPSFEIGPGEGYICHLE